MAHVLPTGRNFYTVDPRSAARRMAAGGSGSSWPAKCWSAIVAETGDYPESVGISIWGTSAMRTHGDDVAQVLALLGVRPVWQHGKPRLDRRRGDPARTSWPAAHRCRSRASAVSSATPSRT